MSSDAALVLKALHEKFDPHMGQKVVLKKLFYDHVKRVFIQCGRKWGKDVELSTQVPTPDGFKVIADIREGDFVFGPDGKPTKVIGVSEVYNRDYLYDVCFCDGSVITASAEHRWVTKTKACRESGERTKKGKTPKVVTTEQIATTLRVGDEWNHSIDCAQPIELKEKDLPIPPYFLGAWLGGGAYGEQLKHLDEELKKLGVIQNKHIPERYLWGSISQRKALLSGLMDADGSCNDDGRCEFISATKCLADGFCHLLASLGQQYRRYVKLARLSGINKKVCSVVSFYPTFNPFVLKRKAECWRGCGKPNYRFIVAVNKVLGRPSKCIAVDNESHTFLVGENFIETHNTQCLMYILYRTMLLTPKSNLIYVAPTIKHAKEIVWESSGGRIQSVLPHWAMELFEIEVRKSDLRIVCNKNQGQILVAGSDQSRSDAGGFFEGLEPDGVGIDETRLIQKDFVDTLTPNLAVKDGFIVFAGTPPPYENHYFVWKKEVIDDPRGYFVKMPSIVNDKLKYLPAFLKNERRKLEARGELDEYMRQYEAEFIPSSEAYILPDWHKHVKIFEDLEV